MGFASAFALRATADKALYPSYDLLRPEADIRTTYHHVCFGPKGDIRL